MRLSIDDVRVCVSITTPNKKMMVSLLLANFSVAYSEVVGVNDLDLT